MCGWLFTSFFHLATFSCFPKARNTHQSSINMDFVSLPILDDLFLECILKMIMEGTFDEVTPQLLELRLVNIN